MKEEKEDTVSSRSLYSYSPPEPEYRRYKIIKDEISSEIENIEKRLIDMQVSFEDSQRATSSGLQNVYDKIIQFENRQKEIETLIQSDTLKNIIEYISNEEAKEIDKREEFLSETSISAFRGHLDKLKSSLAHLDYLVDRFEFE